MAEKLATLSFTDGTPPIDFPVLGGTEGPDVIDVRTLYGKTGKFTYDPGFMSTASCRSSITYIDGEAGILQYRGYPIEQLAESCSFLEVAYLILHGELPNRRELDDFVNIVTRHTMVHEQLSRFYTGFRRDAHPMAVLCGVVGALSAFYHDSIDIYDARSREISAFRLIAKLPTITAMTYKYNLGQPFMYPRNSLSYVDNFLYMMFGTPCEEYKPNPVLARAMERVLILHADHEQNASTSTVRLAGSTGANPFACISAGIASLWGPAHGGAAENVMRMAQEIGDASRAAEYVREKRASKEPVMGFGHRVYRAEDPRARHMRAGVEKLSREMGQPQWYQILEAVVEAMKPYARHGVNVNVDFYAGVVYFLNGIPEDLFVPIFAVGRVPGWTVQVLEQIENNILLRPLTLYNGPEPRDYVPIEKR